MRTNTTLILAFLAVLFLVAGCNGTEQQSPGGDAADETTNPSGPAASAPGSAAEGAVIETMNAGGYTYILVDVGEGPAWYAGPQTQVAVGETVLLPVNAMPMSNFKSTALDRTFELVYFVGSIGKTGAAAATSAAQSPAPAATPNIEITGIEKAEGGLTVAEIFQAGADGSDQEVVVRGKVVKVNAGIMGKNWLHVRDGSGEAGKNDLTITTQDIAKVGDIVLITGKIVTDRDFGAGYKYELLIEDAKVVVE